MEGERERKVTERGRERVTFLSVSVKEYKSTAFNRFTCGEHHQYVWDERERERERERKKE